MEETLKGHQLNSNHHRRECNNSKGRDKQGDSEDSQSRVTTAMVWATRVFNAKNRRGSGNSNRHHREWHR